MNREIMFRGKRMDNGDWVYGLLLVNKLGAYIITEENPHECTQYGYIEIDEYSRVDPETVGQYTGLKDGNGIKIFEGDFVTGDCLDDLPYLVVFSRGSFFIKRQEEYYLLTYFVDHHVCGNCWDNPELLEVMGDD